MSQSMCDVGGESIGARPSEKSSQNTGADGTCGEERYQIDFTCAHANRTGRATALALAPRAAGEAGAWRII